MRKILVFAALLSVALPALGQTSPAGRETDHRLNPPAAPAPAPKAGPFEPGPRLVSGPADIRPGVGFPPEFLNPEPVFSRAAGAVALFQLDLDAHPKGAPPGIQYILQIDPTPDPGAKGPSVVKLLDGTGENSDIMNLEPRKVDGENR